jgi:hypothetical protein
MIVGLPETTQLHQLEGQHPHDQHQHQQNQRKENQIIVVVVVPGPPEEKKLLFLYPRGVSLLLRLMATRPQRK